MSDQSIFTSHDDGRVTVDRWSDELDVTHAVLFDDCMREGMLTFTGRLEIICANGRAVYEAVGGGRYYGLKFRLVEGTLTGEEKAAVSPRPCERCEGCGKLADDDDQSPWTAWENLPPGSDIAVRLGLVKPVPCPVCEGTGSVTVVSQPADTPQEG